MLLNQDGRSKISKERLGRVDNTHFDHRPPLSERKFDTEKWDTVPAADDPNFIEAITNKEHDVRTNGRGGTKRISSYGSDTHSRKKTRKLIEQQTAFAERLEAKAAGEKKAKSPKRKWPSRPFKRSKK